MSPSSPLMSILKRIPINDVYHNLMKTHLNRLLEDAIIQYEHSQVAQQYLVNLVKLTKRWKLASVFEGN